MADFPRSQQVSAIVVVRNGERFLRDALQSIAAQTRPPDEILVIDGQSSDSTAQIAQSFPGVRYLLQPDLGIANARNLAIAHAMGDFLAFLDADDRWTPDKVAVQLELMLANPHLMYTTTFLRLFYEPGTVERPGFQAEGFGPGIEGRFPGTMLTRREVFQRVGPFDPAFALAFEIDWFARAQDAGEHSAVIERVLLHKRIHTQNNSIQQERFRSEGFVVLRRTLARKRAAQLAPTEPLAGPLGHDLSTPD
ncbi:MAG: glycosyltransferase family 2 protein [Caldilinea sp.]|nr:glycosyltransferase family 2 protein [Caldilinea sp.]MCB0149523.1 glycosyltransferase family 2 protein [Caldilineaceae bacterium]MCB9116500.1 glycosyltransferase family 2 protein [Caldilineaceae bacterium]MCB9140731.1 glycosyltransferase family 2 protein [Anaerolineales bacterium]MCO5209339.1 glycosyltransferase family 2 protein [Caldilinea sp.]